MSKRKKSIKKYKDHFGREFEGMPALCKANDIDYGRFYYQVAKKGRKSEDVAKELAGKQFEHKHYGNQMIKEVPKEFKPESIYPGREFKRFLYWQIDSVKQNALYGPQYGYTNVVDAIQKQIDSLPEYWLDVADMIACDMEKVMANYPKDILDYTRIMMKDGLAGYIYGEFSQQYKLGKYRKVA